MRAPGRALHAGRVAQVTMNHVDLPVNGLEAACTEVRRLAERDDWTVTRVEIVGLIPEAELERCSEEFREWAGIGADVTIEGRLAARG